MRGEDEVDCMTGGELEELLSLLLLQMETSEWEGEEEILS